MKQLTFLLLLSCLVSCVENEPMLLDEYKASSEYIIRERPADNPWIPYIPKSTSIETRAGRGALALRNFLGYSLNPQRTPIENTLNLGYPVINKDKLSKSHSSYFTYWKNASHETNVYSYKNIDDYLSKTKFTDKVAHGSEFKFLGIHLGHKHIMISTFGENLINDTTSVFGELNVIANDSVYRMLYSDAIQKEILVDYLDSEFIKNVHTLHPYELYKMYGSLVMTNFCSGGRATAYYVGTHLKSSSEEEQESDLSHEINDSFTWKTNDTGNVNLSIGRGKNGVWSTTRNFGHIKFSATTLGGNAFGFVTPQEVGNTTLDLTSWVASLSNESNNVISKFNQNGLIPVTDFILELNIKNRLRNYINQSTEVSVTHKEPMLMIGKFTANSIWCWFNDRFGNPYTLLCGSFSGSDGVVKTNNWINGITNMFKIKVLSNDTTLNTNNAKEQLASPDPFYNIGFQNIGFHRYKKLIHQGVVYLIDEEDKVGFSIYNNGILINEYGLKDYISSAPAATISYSKLIDDNYKICCL